MILTKFVIMNFHEKVRKISMFFSVIQIEKDVKSLETGQFLINKVASFEISKPDSLRVKKFLVVLGDL